MAKFTWIVMTNCDPAHEQEFNDWYDTTHIADLLRIPGIVSVQRSVRTNAQMSMVDDGMLLTDAASIGARYKYLACYGIDTDDVTDVLRAVQQRSNTPLMEISPYLTEAYTIMYEERR